MDGPLGPAECLAPPLVVEQCNGTACTIPAGCFQQGVEPGDPCEVDEPLHRTVTISRDFEMASIETTRGAFEQLGGGQPWKSEPQEPACKEQCPAEVTWLSAVAACNALSRQRGLRECYACGERMFKDSPFPIFVCDGGPRATFFACRGYRLPSAAEWEYAAKAGAHTPLPNGREPGPLDTLLQRVPTL